LTADERSSLVGTKLLKRATRTSAGKEPGFEDFKLLMVLGRGAFGKVFLAELMLNNKLYAVKSIRKDILIE